MKKLINVVGAVFVRNGRILAAQRGPGKALPGLWEFPGGKIEEGESAEAALQRELAEELRVDVEVGSYLTTTDYEYDFGTVSLATYFVTLTDSEPVLTEHVAIRWLNRQELFEVDWAPADIPAVKLLAQRTELA